MKNLFVKIPIPAAGLMLALAAAGNLVASYGNIYKSIFGWLSALTLLLIILRIITDTNNVIKELDNPVTASVAPTFSMGIIILSTYIKPFSPSAAYGIWIIGIIIHCLFILYFTGKFIFKFDIKKVFPSYFIVYVGIVVGSVSAPAFNAFEAGKIIFWFGFITYIILLPIVIYRVVAVKSIPDPVLPTITIFAAPASLCLAGYMSTFQHKSMVMMWLLTTLSLIMFFSVLFYMPRMLRLKFYPSYSAFTFPCVISAISIKAVNGFLAKTSHSIFILKIAANFELLLAVAIVIYVLIRYINFMLINNSVKAALEE